MVCPRCITAVEQTLKDLSIPFHSIELGSVRSINPVTRTKKKLLAEKLKDLGFELLLTEKSALISKIKNLIIREIHYGSKHHTIKFSVYLSENTGHEYTYISRLFSAVEGITIEKFITKQKVERIKELLFYDENTLSEIAIEMNYSSVAYLSAQFKRETGMTTTAFKSLIDKNRKSLDQF